MISVQMYSKCWPHLQTSVKRTMSVCVTVLLEPLHQDEAQLEEYWPNGSSVEDVLSSNSLVLGTETKEVGSVDTASGLSSSGTDVSAARSEGVAYFAASTSRQKCF